MQKYNLKEKKEYDGENKKNTANFNNYSFTSIYCNVYFAHRNVYSRC